MLESVEELREKGIEFSPAARAELETLCLATEEILTLTERAFTSNDLDTAYEVEPLEEVIDDIKSGLRNNHIVRLKGGACTVETGFIWSDLLTDFERVSDHCSNIALGVIDASEHNMNAHEALRNIKQGNARYDGKYREYSAKYQIKALV